MKKFIILILIIFFAGAMNFLPLQAQENIQQTESAFLKTKISKFTLPNGLTVLTCPKDNFKNISITCIIKAGSIFDKKNKYGASYLTASLFSSCLKERLDKDILFVLSDNNYYTENIRFEIKTTPHKLESALNILADALTAGAQNFALPQFQNTKNKIKNELYKKLSSTDIKNMAILYNQNYSKVHPYNHFYMGNIEDLSSINMGDVISFYDMCYIPKDTIISIVGDISFDDVKNIIQKKFSQWNYADAPAIDLSQAKKEKNVNIQAGDFSKGSYMMMLSNITILRNSSDYYTLNLLNYLLGGNPYKNWLMDKLQKGGANFAYSVFAPSLGNFCWQIYINFSNSDKFENVIKLTHDTLKTIAREPVSNEELNKAKEYFIKKFPSLMNSPSNLSLMLALIGYYDLGLDYFDKYESFYNDVTSYKIIEAGEKYLNPDNMNVLIVKE